MFCLWPLAPPPHLEHFAYLSQVPKPVPAAALPGVLVACLCRCSWEGSEGVPAGAGGTQHPRSPPSERRWEAAGASRGGKQGGMPTGGGGAGPGAVRGLLRVWSAQRCLHALIWSSWPLAAGPVTREVPWKQTDMCSLPSRLIGAFVESPLKGKRQVRAVTAGPVPWVDVCVAQRECGIWPQGGLAWLRSGCSAALGLPAGPPCPPHVSGPRRPSPRRVSSEQQLEHPFLRAQEGLVPPPRWPSW